MHLNGRTSKLSVIRATDRRTGFFASYIGCLSRLVPQVVLRFGRSGLPGSSDVGFVRAALAAIQ